MSKVILDLCGGTGSWSLPYRNAGYDVWVITLPEYDVLRWKTYGFAQLIKNGDVYGILAAPPCTMFSDARTNAREPRDLVGGFSIVQACLDIIHECRYKTRSDQQKYPPLKFWALENPWYGRLKWFLGYPNFVFSPWEFGDAYKKKTAIWGYFNEPVKTHKTNSQVLPKFDYMSSKDIAPEWFGKLDRQARRAITPKGFAQAFYEANK